MEKIAEMRLIFFAGIRYFFLFISVQIKEAIAKKLILFRYIQLPYNFDCRLSGGEKKFKLNVFVLTQMVKYVLFDILSNILNTWEAPVSI